MKLIEIVLEANGQAPAGHEVVRLPDGIAEEAPTVVALTCVDPRLNGLLPGRLGLAAERFVWLRSAGNIVTEPDGNMVRSLALACAIKSAREILVIGHTDCAVCKTTVLKLTESFAALGVAREELPDNLVEFFGLFASERQNVLRAVEVVRHSPLIGAELPVHGLLLDVETGRLERLVNGYEAFQKTKTIAIGAPTLESTHITAPESSVAPAIERSEPVQPGDAGSPDRSMPPAYAEQLGAGAGATWTLPEMRLGKLELPQISVTDVGLPKIKIGDASLDLNEWLRRAPTPASSAAEAIPMETGAADEAVEDVQSSREDSEGKLSPESLFDQTRRYKVIGSDHRVYGPINGMKVLQWISEGRIRWDTPSQLEGSQEWRPLEMWAEIARRILQRKPSP